MNEIHDELRDGLGDVVLGRLSDDRRRALDAHLATCEECRTEVESFEALALSLRGVDPDRFPAPGSPAPAALDARMEQVFAAESAREARRTAEAGPDRTHEIGVSRAGRLARRWAPTLGGALAGAAAVAVAVAVLPGDDAATPAPVIAVQGVSTTSGVSASAGLVDHTWGVELRLRMDGLAPDRAYDVRILDDEGTAHDSGAFLGVPDRTITCSMSSSVLLVDAARFEVVDPDGAVVISGPMES